MSARFANAIVRLPGHSLAFGLTTAGMGPPSIDLALAQHERYCEALRACGLSLVVLPADEAHPDATFVEDTAIVAGGRAIATRPGAPSRSGEVTAVREALARFFDRIDEIEAPGTLDGGDVCEADDRAFVGLSQRTNEEGARQLQAWFAAGGLDATIVDIRDVREILHLKSGMAYLGDGRYAVIDALLPRLALPHGCVVRVAPEEAYGANCVRVNDAVLVATGHPKLESALAALGLETIALDVSEYCKLDGGLSCLSVRF